MYPPPLYIYKYNLVIECSHGVHHRSSVLKPCSKHSVGVGEHTFFQGYNDEL